jgi:two-component system, chemotaxis family, protein-glutamate methylesterase/glutaminase
MSPNLASNLASTGPIRKIRVLVVEDSSVIRGLLTRWLSVEADIEIVGAAINGQQGVEKAKILTPDIVLLDIEMPVMDGMTALPEILKVAPKARVIMASTLTRRGGETTIRALSAGASDYLAKPEAGQIEGAAEYKRDLLMKVRMLGARALRGPQSDQAPVARPSSIFKNNSPLRPTTGGNVRAVTSPAVIPKIVLIGASTGGPEALRVVIAGLQGKVSVPVLITQHMPALFTKILAEHLSKQTGATVVEAENGMEAKAGCFYIAPGSHHMTMSHSSNVVRLELNSNPPENYCRPAVDPLFRSAATAMGERVLAVILTGMGHDGREGARALVDKGAMLIAQDEDTSVVWGMPGSVIRAGLAASCKPLNDIAPTILNVLRGVAL